MTEHPNALTSARLDDVTTSILQAAAALKDEGYCPEHAAELVAVHVKRGLSLILLAEEGP